MRTPKIVVCEVCVKVIVVAVSLIIDQSLQVSGMEIRK